MPITDLMGHIWGRPGLGMKSEHGPLPWAVGPRAARAWVTGPPQGTRHAPNKQNPGLVGIRHVGVHVANSVGGRSILFEEMRSKWLPDVGSPWVFRVISSPRGRFPPGLGKFLPREYSRIRSYPKSRGVFVDFSPGEVFWVALDQRFFRRGGDSLRAHTLENMHFY